LEAVETVAAPEGPKLTPMPVEPQPKQFSALVVNAAPSPAGVAVQQVAAILLRSPERAREIADELSTAGVEVVAAASSESFYSFVNSQRVDLGIIVPDLGGLLSGLEILERLYKDLLRPDTILLAESGYSTTERAGQLGIEKLLDPQTNLRGILDAAQAVLACRSAARAFIPQRARRLVEQFEHIPPLPQLLVKLLSYMDLDAHEVPLKQLADDISVDSKATAALLALTNSSSTGVRQKISRVFDAVNLLGSRRTIALVVSAATMSTQAELLKEWSEPLRNWYRQRSVLIASTAATFARRMESVSPDTAFVLGLLQDVGIIVLGSCFEGRYAETTLRRVREIGQLQLQVVEQEDYKLTHPEVSAALLQKWGLPQSLIGLVLDHHKFDMTAERSRVDQSFLRAMQIGEALADLNDLTHPVRRQHLNRLLAEYSQERSALCRDCITESVAQTVESCRLFAVPVPSELAMGQLIGQIEQLHEQTARGEPLAT
jgi:HD-like signal output (HDOD) protein